jgi:transposase-like protein
LGTTHRNTNENSTPIHKHERCDEAFQRSPVKHWLISGKSARQICAELGVAAQTRHRWRKKVKSPACRSGGWHAGGAPGGKPAACKKGAARAVQQRDILKKPWV